jgi:hypothetical protein
MAIKRGGYDGEPEASKRLRGSNWNKDHVKMDFDRIIVSNDNGWKYGGVGKEMGEFIERTPANLKESLGARLLNAPMSLESCDVGMTFQLKMLEFVDSMNQELLVGKEVRADETKWLSPALIMQGVRPSSWTKKLANVNMPSMLVELGKASKVKEFVLDMDNYYDVQRLERNNKVPKAVTLLIDHALKWWTSKNVQ